MSIANELASEMLSLIDRMYKTYHEHTELESLNDKQKIDIEHAIENTKADVRRGYILYKQLHDVLLERRKAKEERETLQYLHDFLCQNKQFKNGLVNCLKGIRTKERMQKEAIYTPRIVEDLMECIEGDM